MRNSTAWLLRKPSHPIWRAPGSLQLGLESQVILEDVPPECAAIVATLNRPHTKQALLHSSPTLDPSWIDWLLATLDTAGLLQAGSLQVKQNVEIVGGQGLAALIQTALASNEVNAELTHELHRESGLVVIAQETFEPDRSLLAKLVYQKRPHLIVRAEPGRARVGPLVVPGITSCLNCHDLFLGTNDDAWPYLLAQLCRLVGKPEPYLCNWVAATTALQVHAFINDTEPDGLGRVLEVNIKDHALRELTLAAHPECPCTLLTPERFWYESGAPSDPTQIESVPGSGDSYVT
ncbi:MAG: TOMM precursor leader peptide-binding protein [Propionibacteriaceae bacterium]|nr:TOMM precursor leader peptide-binding protein [Propionibacteriaceae bacterium]